MNWQWDSIAADPVDFMGFLDEADREYVLNGLTAPEQRELNERWHRWAHEGQDPDDGDWRIWMIMAGRGYGKTRAGSEWVSRLARADGSLRFALVGATIEDVRKVMIEGESGLIRVARTGEKVIWNSTKGEVAFPSGALAHVYSAESFEKLRGPEHHYAWCDELGKWNNAEDCWNNLTLGLRLADKSRVLVTTTPRSVRLLRRLKVEQGVELRGGKTCQNLNLPDGFVESVRALYEGTRLGRQELDGELLEDVEGAFWTRELIERCRVNPPRNGEGERAFEERAGRVPARPQDGGGAQAEIPALSTSGELQCAPPPPLRGGSPPPLGEEFKRIVIGVDPPASSGGDACGIVVAGLGVDGKAYVLADHSVEHPTPERWARAVASAAEVWGADRVVAEANNGGDMVISTLRAADVAMPVSKVHASRGKAARAEPVSMLYEADKVFHLGTFPELEDQLCGLTSGGGYEGPGRSPDRADALVWALTELMLGKPAKRPRVSLL